MDRSSERRGSVHQPTVQAFGDEWTRFNQSSANANELESVFLQYFGAFPWQLLPADAIGFDLGCGSGRWAVLAASRVGTLVCVDASIAALRVAQRNAKVCPLVLGAAGALPLRPCSMDFGYSLGVLHHLSDPLSSLTDAVAALKPGAPLLIYLYYAFDNRRPWFRVVWRVSDGMRRLVSRCPRPVRFGLSELLAATVYFPLARLAGLWERSGRPVASIPLAAYRNLSFYTMRTDALDRFGTRVEHRFTRPEVMDLMERAGLERVSVSDEPPYWCAVGFRPSD
ncbi:MAG: class I SAM-dependent methyltransferase [Actinomycetota bacterium]|nr:class I SAM-dependent methyltransferase [Actinomycetota bacterium]